MNTTPANSPLPFNEWTDHFDAFIRPLHLGEFELTPILRARYGNMLRDNIVSVRLFAEGRTLVLIIAEVGNAEKIIVDFAVTWANRTDDMIGLDDLFSQDAPAAPARDAALDERQVWFNHIIPSFLTLFDCHETASCIPVFTKHYLALLERIHYATNFSYAEKTEERLNLAVKFCEGYIKTLAKPLKEEAWERLISMLTHKLKKQTATGILGSDLNTYWDEIGVIAEQGSDNMLYEMLCDQIDREVYDAIVEDLPEAEQLALWLCSDDVNCEREGWLPETVKDFESGFKKDFSSIDMALRDELMGKAMNSLSPAAREYLDY